MGMKTYFFDAYAFFELIQGNPKYVPYADNVAIVTTVLQLMEFHYGLIRDLGKQQADLLYDTFLPFAIDVDDETIKEANAFKYRMKKKNLSYIDCLGYILARRKNIPFLTGDKVFKDLPGVEFVK
jgi:predicted nucleic acid-binding protein